MEPSEGAIVVAGALAQRPRLGGHTWVFLQYLLGLRRLGWDVLFLDWLEPSMGDVEPSLAYLRGVMERFGLGDAFAVLDKSAGAMHGVPRDAALEHTRRSVALLNVMGYLDDPELLAAAQKRVFVDIDPGFTQMWQEAGLADLLAGHDEYVTVAENMGRAGCSVPSCGVDWITSRQPVVLEQWQRNSASGEEFTSVGAWRGPYAPVEFAGRTYGLRVHEFRRFVSLPELTGAGFELALEIDPGEERDLTRLAEAGWRLVEPRAVAGDPWSYRSYIRGSRAEFMVAKNMYVDTASGWFSDRSACYLASGKPVLAQDTGLRDLYPTGDGLIVYSTLDEAVAGVDEIRAHYDHHSRAAREIAEEYFDSDRVLTGLLQKLDVA
jgi:hypothetical protein